MKLYRVTIYYVAWARGRTPRRIAKRDVYAVMAESGDAAIARVVGRLLPGETLSQTESPSAFEVPDGFINLT